jgi:hypothetical protein
MITQKQMHAIRQQTMQQFAAVLTPDQMQQLRSMHHAHSRGEQQQPAPTTLRLEVSTTLPRSPRHRGLLSTSHAGTTPATHFHAKSP